MLKNIRNCFIAIILLPLFFILALASWFAIENLETELERRLQEEIELVARSLRYPVTDALKSGRVSALESSLFAAIDIRRIYGIYVYNPDGELLVSAGPITPQDLAKFAALISERKDRFQEYTEFNQQEVFSFLEPLKSSEGEVKGYLQIVRERSGIISYIDGIKLLSVIFVLAVSALIIIILIGGYALIIGRPFSKILDEIDRFDSAKLDKVEVVKFPKEFDRLSVSLNQMIEKMRSYQKEIEVNNQEKINLETKLISSKKLAVIGELAAGVAHDIGNPMSVVDATSQRLLRIENADPKVKRNIESIREEVIKMQRIVRELLDYSTQGQNTNRWTDIDDLIKSCLRNYFDSDKDVEFIYEDALIEALIDPVKFEQVFLNLTKNAREALRFSSKDKRIKIVVSVKDQGVELIVSDSGPGIDSDKKEKIFDAFYSEKSSVGGTGLGLAICSNIVESYDGSIECTDNEWGGTSFVCHFKVGVRSLSGE